MGGYYATLLADREGMPIFRIERFTIPHESDPPFEEILERLLIDAERIARGIGVQHFQASLLETDEGELPGFPAVCSPFGPMVDARPARVLADFGFEPLEEHGYFRVAADTAPPPGGADGAGRAYRWGEEDLVHYGRLWTEHCAGHLPDYLFLASRLIPLDTRLQHRIDSADRLSRVRFLGDGPEPAGLVSWYPDLHPQFLADGGEGARVRLRLGTIDAGAVTVAKVLKCFAPRAEGGAEEALLEQGIAWAGAAARSVHPNLKWLQAGPVALSHRSLISVLERAGFQSFGRLSIHEKRLA
jgi:hypothetical protein